MDRSAFRVHFRPEYPDPFKEFREDLLRKTSAAENRAGTADRLAAPQQPRHNEIPQKGSQKTWSDIAKNESKLLDFKASPAQPPQEIAKTRTCCSFCFKNGEREEVFSSHSLYTVENIVSCPKLRLFRCKICGYAGGNYAHTKKYCPLLKQRLLSGSIMSSRPDEN